MTYLLQKVRLKSSSLLDRKWAKGSLPEEKHHGKKRKIAYSKLQMLKQKGGMMSMMVKMSENQLCQSQVHVTAFRCLRFKSKKAGLNRQLSKPILRGGGGLVLIHLIT